MFIEPKSNGTASLEPSEIFPLFSKDVALLRSVGNLFGGLAINIWPLCGQVQSCLRTSETLHYGEIATATWLLVWLCAVTLISAWLVPNNSSGNLATTAVIHSKFGSLPTHSTSSG